MTTHAAKILFAFLGAAIAWFVQFMLSYSLVEIACKTSVFGFTLFGLSGFTLVVILESLLFGVVAVLAGLAAYRTLERRDRAGWSSASRDRQRFMAYTGLVMSVLFTLLIFLTAISMAFVPVCD